MLLLVLPCKSGLKTNISTSVFIANHGTSILFGVIYWYIWKVLIPHHNGYTLEETTATLDDGTSITRLVQVPIGSKVAVPDFNERIVWEVGRPV